MILPMRGFMEWHCDEPELALIVAAVNALPDLIELAKAAKRSKMWRHHQDCNPLRECRCGLFDLDAALARLDGDGK